MSKVMESLVNGDLEEHLKKLNRLPGSQYGFRPKRSCTSALAAGELVHLLETGRLDVKSSKRPSHWPYGL
jgi:hypothetical protein